MLKLEVGKTYLDGCDFKVRIIATDVRTSSSLLTLGLRDNGDYEELNYYTLSGRDSVINSSKFDIVSEYKPPEYHWFNLWDTMGAGLLWPTLEQAKRQISNGSGLIGTYRIDINTGEITKV
jgi:hypothetical protein